MATLFRASSTPNERTSAVPSGAIVISPFIQSVYPSTVIRSLRASASAENVAPDWQYCAQPSQPLPVSQASKNSPAVSLIDVMKLPSLKGLTPIYQVCDTLSMHPSDAAAPTNRVIHTRFRRVGRFLGRAASTGHRRPARRQRGAGLSRGERATSRATMGSEFHSDDRPREDP